MKNKFLRALCLLCALLLAGAVALTGCGKEEAADNSHVEEQHDHGHNHETAETLDVSYTLEKDNTFTLTIKDHDGTVLLTKTGLKQKALAEQVSDTVFSLGWATGTGANDYEMVYCSRMTCQVSEVFVSPFACDGVRVVLPQGNNKDGYSVLIRDVFDSKGYSKTYPLTDAYTKGDQAVVFGGKLVGNGQATVSYLVGPNREHRIVQFDLYEDKTAESRPTATTTKKD